MSRPRLLRIAAAFAACLGPAERASCAAAQAVGATPSAEELLVKVEQACAQCRSYRDRGIATPSRRGMARVPFTTAFVAPARFRFEWGSLTDEDDKGEKVLWRDGAAVREWSDDWKGPAEATSIAELLRGDDDDSGFASIVVPPLLPCSDGAIAPITRLAIEGEPVHDVIDRRGAWMVRVSDHRAEWTLWIDATRFVFLRVDRDDHDKDEPDWSIRYEPELDVEVAEEELALTTPWPDQRSSSSEWMFRLAPIGGIALGLTSIYFGRKAQILRRPIVVPNSHFVVGALVIFASHPIGQLLGSWSPREGFGGWSGKDWFSTAMLGVMVAGGILSHLHGWGGYAVVGASVDVVRRALQLCLKSLGVELVGKDDELRSKDGKLEFHVKAHGSSRVTMNAKGKASARILHDAIPLMEACFESEAVPYNSIAAWWRVVKGVMVTLVSFGVAVGMWHYAG